jgi:hypothetical protein
MRPCFRTWRGRGRNLLQGIIPWFGSKSWGQSRQTTEYFMYWLQFHRDFSLNLQVLCHSFVICYLGDLGISFNSTVQGTVISFTNLLQFIFPTKTLRGPGSSVGIATGYGLEVWGSKKKSRWGRDFSYTSTRAPGPNQSPVQWVPGLSPGVKRPGSGADHLSPPSAEVENE